MIKFLFYLLIFILLNCCPNKTIIQHEKLSESLADTIQGFLYDVPNDSFIVIEYRQFSTKDTTIHIDTVKSIIIVPKIK